MEIFKELTEIKNSCLGLGFFDGLHLGHRALVQKLVANAKKYNSKSIIITFKASPAEKFFNEVKYINTLDERENIISSLGVDYMIELDFNEKLMSLSAEDYLKNVLIKYFDPNYIICGFNHTFGFKKQGNCDFLRENESIYGYEFESLYPVKFDSEVVSSTLVKDALSKGNIKKTTNLLDTYFKIGGEVIKGNQIGRTIGFPTANITYPETKVIVPFGVYKVNVEYAGDTYDGILNFGRKPTVNSDNVKPVAEVHIIGFNRDIYGEKIDISLIDKIRDERKFDSLDDLKSQIKEDLSKC